MIVHQQLAALTGNKPSSKPNSKKKKLHGALLKEVPDLEANDPIFTPNTSTKKTKKAAKKPGIESAKKPTKVKQPPQQKKVVPPGK